MDLLRLYSEIPRGFLLEKTDMQKRRTNTQGLDSKSLVKIDRIVERIILACTIPIVQPYAIGDVYDMATSRVPRKDEKLRETFGAECDDEGEHLPLMDRPAVLLDRDGIIIGWYLPSLFSSEVSDHVMNSTVRLGSLPETVLGIKMGTDNWRYNPSSYREEEECNVPPGHVVLSPCWFELGHDHTNSKPAPSVTLRTESGGGMAFLEEVAEVNALLGALLAIVHPDLYDMQFEVLKRLNTGTHKVQVNHAPVMHEALDHWASPFTGMAIISNRETPFHRDMKGGKLLYDLVATFGKYKGGRFEVPLLGHRFVYGPGTSFILPGYLFEHGASRVDGDRVCFAQFIKPNVGYGAFYKYKEIDPPTVDLLREKFGLAIAR